ncbi:MAG TPA: hypothetical protein VHE35_23995 [Kofleriaceae bacterium]|nr:hypothetical protein [Kofleriaceae bacterium]
MPNEPRSRARPSVLPVHSAAGDRDEADDLVDAFQAFGASRQAQYVVQALDPSVEDAFSLAPGGATDAAVVAHCRRDARHRLRELNASFRMTPLLQKGLDAIIDAFVWSRDGNEVTVDVSVGDVARCLVDVRLHATDEGRAARRDAKAFINFVAASWPRPRGRRRTAEPELEDAAACKIGSEWAAREARYLRGARGDFPGNVAAAEALVPAGVSSDRRAELGDMIHVIAMVAWRSLATPS